MTLTLIEADAERARFIADKLTRSVVLHGDARDREIHEEANLRTAQAIVSVTNNDEVNIMAALLAKRYGCEQALTLVNNNVYGGLLGSLGIDVVVNPRETTVSSVLQHVRRGRIKSVYSLRDGEAEVFEAEALETSPLVGQPLREARLPSRRAGRRDRARRRGDHAARRHRDPRARPRDRGGARRGGQARREAVRGAGRVFLSRRRQRTGSSGQMARIAYVNGRYRPLADRRDRARGPRLPVRRRRLRGDQGAGRPAARPRAPSGPARALARGARDRAADVARRR